MSFNFFPCRLSPGIAFNLVVFCVTLWLLPIPSAQAQTFTVLHTFHGRPDGVSPSASPILDSSGNLYGTTSFGGRHFNGTAFKVTPGGKETVLYSFVGVYGEWPGTPLLRDEQGTLYGTTGAGGVHRDGTVFRLNGKGNERVLFNFSNRTGGGPNSLIRDAEGNLYGTLETDGCYSCGAVFKLTPAGKMHVLYTFTGGQDGGSPIGNLVRDSAGNLYGTTWYGGDMNCAEGQGCGTVFKLDPAGHETVLHAFAGSPNDGEGPRGGWLDKNGTFYGATSLGGSGSACELGCGMVYKLDPDGTETVLYDFTGEGGDGDYPVGGVTLDDVGNVYGATLDGRGGQNPGAIFLVDPTGKETILHTFTGSPDGAGPNGVTLDGKGNIFGTTEAGGDPNCGGPYYGCGTVFKLIP